MQNPSYRLLRGSLAFVTAVLAALHALPGAADTQFRQLAMEEGLSNNEVYTVIQDKQGYIWLGTFDGLDRYDGYTFKVFRHDQTEPRSISGNLIRALYEDDKGRVWAGTFSDGLNLYDPDSKTFKHYRHVPGDPTSLISDSIWSLGSAPDGSLLVGTFDSGLDVLDPDTGKVRHFPAGSGPQAPSNNQINDIFVDSRNHIWLATLSGLDEFDPSGHTPPLHIRSSETTVNNAVWGVAEDAEHRLWLATQHGPYVYIPGETSLRKIPGIAPRDNTLTGLFLYKVYVDDTQNVWYGGEQDGLFLIRHGAHVIQHFKHALGNNESLAANDVWDVFKDKAGYLWIATHTGVSLLDPDLLDVYSLKPSDIPGSHGDSVDALRQYGDKLLIGAIGAIYAFPLGSTQDSLNGTADIFMKLNQSRYNKISAIDLNDDHNLLVGTGFDYLLEINPHGKIVHTWRPGEDIGLRTMRPIHRILTKSPDEIYIATFGNGLLDFNIKNSSTRQVIGSGRSELGTGDFVEDVLRTSQDTIWAGTFRGLFQVDTRDNHSSLLPLLPGSSEPAIQCLYEDERRVLWIATYRGMWRMQLDASGLPATRPDPVQKFKNVQILSIEPDSQGNLWLATINSLIRYNTSSGEIMTFGRDQGSPMSEYYSYGHTQTSDGRLWFAGGQGAIGFLPKNLHPNRRPPGVTLNSALAYRKDQPVPLPLMTGQPLTLSYQDRISIFDVAATDFGAPAANTYSYRLVGFQPEWTPPAPSHLITFTNLNPGRYRLEVRAANNWGTWSVTPAALDIVVLPPWWRTWWAYTIYLLVIIGSAIAYVYSLKRKITREKAISASLREANEIKSNFVEKLEVQVKEATQELRETLQGVNLKNAELEIAQRRAAEGEQVKSQFLANMSHELRTPLTGVLGYTKLLNSTNLSSEQKDYVGTIRVSSESLLAIINDTLDLSRLEAGKLLIDEVDFDLLELTESTLELLAPIAYQKRLELIRVIPPEIPLNVRGDPLRLRQVLTNLLSNAIKFTESGSVCLEIQLLEQSDRDATVMFRIMDTGIGIPEGEIGQLFNAYARGRISTRHQVEGTGLGLAICKKLLDLMGGHVDVESRVGTGSTFQFQLKFRLQKHAAPRQQLPKKLSVLLYDKHPLSNAAWKASLTRLGADVREVTELESLMALQAEAAVLSLSERELSHLGELKQKFSPALPPMLILAPRIDRQTLKDLSETLFHRVLSKTAREKTVYLELQSLVQHAIHVPEPAVESKPADPKPSARPAADAPLVLVADDNRINRRLLVTMLNQSGFRTTEAGNGIELLDLAARGGWQAALLDIHMPGMDGIETATRLRIIYGESTPPIIAMSADVLPGGQNGPQQGLMDDFLMKPFNEHQLVNLLRTHIERHRRRGRTAG
jgi:signal transduction histidine kinase/CheY-like chemotaxis protein/sugar lactone lactonase YvrE